MEALVHTRYDPAKPVSKTMPYYTFTFTFSFKKKVAEEKNQTGNLPCAQLLWNALSIVVIWKRGRVIFQMTRLDKNPNPVFILFSVIKPISSVAHLKLNTKPEESNFTTPKILLTVVFDDIAVGLSKLQVLVYLQSVGNLDICFVLNSMGPSWS